MSSTDFFITHSFKFDAHFDNARAPFGDSSQFETWFLKYITPWISCESGFHMMALTLYKANSYR